jgi:hypothetical protein
MDKHMLKKPSIDDFKKQIAFSQSLALKNIERALATITAKRASQGCLLSGGTIILFGRKASKIIDTFSNQLLEDVSAFSDQLNLPISDLVAEANTTIIQLKLQVLELRPVETLEKAIKQPSVKTEMLKLMNDAIEEAKMRLKKLELGLRHPNQIDVTKITQNSMSIGNFQGQFQQGDHNNLSISNSPINFSNLEKAIELLEIVIKENMNAGQNSALGDIQNDVDTIKLQLKKNNPSKSIIAEATGSLRRIIEGGIGGVLATQLTPLLPAILTAVGST